MTGEQRLDLLLALLSAGWSADCGPVHGSGSPSAASEASATTFESCESEQEWWLLHERQPCRPAQGIGANPHAQVPAVASGDEPQQPGPQQFEQPAAGQAQLEPSACAPTPQPAGSLVTHTISLTLTPNTPASGNRRPVSWI